MPKDLGKEIFTKGTNPNKTEIGQVWTNGQNPNPLIIIEINIPILSSEFYQHAKLYCEKTKQHIYMLTDIDGCPDFKWNWNRIK